MFILFFFFLVFCMTSLGERLAAEARAVKEVREAEHKRQLAKYIELAQQRLVETVTVMARDGRFSFRYSKARFIYGICPNDGPIPEEFHEAIVDALKTFATSKDIGLHWTETGEHDGWPNGLIHVALPGYQ